MMEKFRSKVMVLEFPGKIPSVNEYLTPGLCKKKRWSKSQKKMVEKVIPIVFKSEAARNYQSYILKELRRITSHEDRSIMRSWKWYRIKIEAIFNHGYNSRDADNIIKLTNDTIFNQFLKVDDRFCNSVTSEKYEDMRNRKEYLVITLMENEDNRKKFQ